MSSLNKGSGETHLVDYEPDQSDKLTRDLEKAQRESDHEDFDLDDEEEDTNDAMSEKRQAKELAREKAKQLRKEFMAHLATLTPEEYKEFLNLSEMDEGATHLAVPLEKRREQHRQLLILLTNKFWQEFDRLQKDESHPFRYCRTIANGLAYEHLTYKVRELRAAWPSNVVGLDMLDYKLREELAEMYNQQRVEKRKLLAMRKPLFKDRLGGLEVMSDDEASDIDVPNWVPQRPSEDGSGGGGVTTTPRSSNGSVHTPKQQLGPTFSSFLDTTTKKASPFGVNTPANMPSTSTLHVPRSLGGQPRWDSTWHTSAPIGKDGSTLTETSELTVKVNGVEITIPKLMKLTDLPAWLRRIAQVRETLATQVKSDGEIDRYLNLKLLLSDAARMEISAILLSGQDVIKFSVAEVFRVMEQYATHIKDTTPAGVIDVMRYIYGKIPRPNKWEHSHSALAVSCEEWISNAYILVFTAVQATKCQLNTKVTIQLFYGCLEPAAFRQHLVRITDAKAQRGDMTTPIVGKPTQVKWDSIDSVLQVALAEGRRIDDMSRDNAGYFQTLGTSPAHKTQFQTLDSQIRDLAKPLRLQETERKLSNPFKRGAGTKRSHSPPNAGGNKKPKTSPENRKSEGKEEKQPKPTNPTLPCRLCNELGHRARECPRGVCFPGCSEKPSKTHDPFNCDHNPFKQKAVAKTTSSGAPPISKESKSKKDRKSKKPSRGGKKDK